MARSKIYGGKGLTGQALRDTVFSDQIMEDTYLTREVQTKSAPPPAPYEPIDFVFYAGLGNNVKAKLGDDSFIDGVFARSSAGTYRASSGSVLEAATNESRHEFVGGTPRGLLAEPGSTNVCTNWNANPDASLTGLVVTGNAVLSRVADTAELASAGLDVLCSDGNVIKLDNSGSASASSMTITGDAGGTGQFAASAYCRGSGGNVRLGTSSALDNPVALTASYERIQGVVTVAAGTEIFRLLIDAGVTLYLILNQLEALRAASSSVVVQGAAVSRAADLLNWVVPAGTIPTAEGMMAISLWFPRSFSQLEPPSGTDDQHLVAWAAPGTGWWLFAQLKAASTRHFVMRGNTGVGGTLDAFVNAATLAAGQVVVAARWKAANGYLQIGYKQGGSWTWGVQETTFANFTDAGNEIHTYGNLWTRNEHGLYIWPQDKGTAWLEAFFAGTAE